MAVGWTVLLVFLVDLLNLNGSYQVHVQAFFAAGLPTQHLSEYQWGAFLPHRRCQDELEVSAVFEIDTEKLVAQTEVVQISVMLCMMV